MRLRGEYPIETDEDRVQLIANLIEEGSQDPVIRKLSLDILRKTGVREKDSHGEIKAIFDWVKKNIQYRGDVFCRDSYHLPKRTIELQSGDCFPLTQKIIVKNKETGDYELPELGDLKDCYSKYEALSYNFLDQKWEFKNILNWINKGNRQIVETRLDNGAIFEATQDHRVFTIEGQKRNKFKIEVRELSKIDLSRSWKRRLLTAHKIPSLNKDYDSNKLWLYGMYAAEGYYSKEGWKVSIANDDKYVRMETAGRLNNLKTPHSLSKREKHGFITVLESPFKDELKTIGRISKQKEFPNSILSLNETAIEILLDGYAIGDAYIPRPNTAWFGKVRRIYNTISDKLAKQLVHLHLILGKPLYVQYQENHMGAGKNPIWRLYDRIHGIGNGKSAKCKEFINGLKYAYIDYIVPSISKEVCDITIEDNHNFVLDNGLLVHNCDDYSILLNSMLSSIGFQTGLRIITMYPDKGFHHIYSLVNIRGYGWLPLDAVNKQNKVGDEPKYFKKRDFMISCGD